MKKHTVALSIFMNFLATAAMADSATLQVNDWTTMNAASGRKVMQNGQLIDMEAHDDQKAMCITHNQLVSMRFIAGNLEISNASDNSSATFSYQGQGRAFFLMCTSLKPTMTVEEINDALGAVAHFNQN